MHETLLREIPELLEIADVSRRIANGKLDMGKRSVYGQYMTPAAIASFMVSLFPPVTERNVKLLDPGAGVGSLTSAFVAYSNERSHKYDIDVDAYEIDPVMRSFLEQNLSLCKSTLEHRAAHFSWRIISEDFIVTASKNIAMADSLWNEISKRYTHCIMNPPYKKISSGSHHRSCLRSIGIETVNLYSAFVALSLSLMEIRGYLVAIIPRSFCNGPYYRPFREFLLKYSAIRHIHLFTSRNKAFKEDKVLQENIVIMLERGGQQGDVKVTTSTDDHFADMVCTVYPFNRIVIPDDPERVVHIPTSPAKALIAISPSICFSLADIGVQVSTGPVVDFRLKEQLKRMPGPGTVPLLYPCHFSQHLTQWPRENGKKPNAILFNAETEKWLYPTGFYTVVRRFSAKEENRRIVASVVEPEVFPNAKMLGFENHLNVFHIGRQGLPEALARGLAVFLNTTAVDENFRCFSGHTQVNATDLRLMKYPSRETLISFGNWVMQHNELTQDLIDEQMEKIAE